MRIPGEINWIDLYTEYGISFTEASLSQLMTPAPNKEAVENKSRLQHGKRVVRKAKYTKKDERTVTLEMHLTAPDRRAFWSRYRAFCTDFLDVGHFDIYNSDIGSDMIFRMTYVSCNEFSEFAQQIAKFTLTLNEPDPSNRGSSDKWEEEDN